MDMQQMIQLAVHVLLIAGALNWGLVAYNGTDMVAKITKGGEPEKYAKLLVAAAGLYQAAKLSKMI